MDIVTLGAALSGAKKYTDDVVHGIAGGITYKGEVNYYSNLPSNPTLGDAYTVKYSGTTGTNPDGTEYVWAENGGVAQWVDFSKDSYTKAETDALLNNKQNALVVGTNLDDEPIEDSTNPITSGGVYNTVGNLDAALDSLIMSLEPKTITENGTYNPEDDGVDGYSSVSVDVANSYTVSDEGKVVSNGSLVAQTAMSQEITANDTYDTTLYNSVTVNVPSGEEVYPITTNNSTVTLNNLYYTLKNKVFFIFGTIMASSNAGINLLFSKPLSELGIDFSQMQSTTIKTIAGSNWNSVSWSFNKDTTAFEINVLSQTVPTYVISVIDLSNII